VFLEKSKVGQLLALLPTGTDESFENVTQGAGQHQVLRLADFARPGKASDTLWLMTAH
jgi:hypothetical protein